MADESSITAFFGGDVSGLEKAVGSANVIVGSFQSAMAKIGITIGAAAVIGFFKSVIDRASDIKNMSDALDIGTEQLQAFEFAVRSAGGNMQDAGTMLRNLRNRVDELASGNEKAAETFAKLGVTQKDIIGIPLEAALEKVSKGYVANKDSAGAYAAITDIVGARSTKLLGVLQTVGTDGFYKGIELPAQSAGQVMSNVLELEEAGNKLEAWKGRLIVWGANVLDVVEKSAMGIKWLLMDAFTPGTGVASAATYMAEHAKKAEAAVNAVTDALKGQVGTVKDFVAFNEAAWKREMAYLEMRSEHEQAQQKRLQMAKVYLAEAEKYRENSKEQLDLIAKAEALILDYDKEQVKEKRELVAGYAEEAEYARLMGIRGRELTEAEKRRIEIHKLVTDNLWVERELQVLLKDGYDNLSDEDKENVRQLQLMSKEIKLQIGLKSALVATTQVQETAEQRVTREIQEQNNLIANHNKMELAKASGDIAKEENQITAQTRDALARQDAAQKRGDLGAAIAIGGELIRLKEQMQALKERQTDFEGAYSASLLGPIRGAAEFGQATDEVLKEIVRRNEEKIAAIRKSIFENPTWGQNYHDRMEIANIQLDSGAAKKELDLRRSMRGKPYEQALRDYEGDPLHFDTLFRQVNEGYKKADMTNDQLKQINDILKNVFK